MEPQTIFFSYNRKDAAFALQLAKDLMAKGANVWIDQLSIRPGERWDKAIESALRKADHLLVVLSPASVAADNVLDEVNYAIANKKHIFPAIYKECDIPYRLQGFQYIYFSDNYEQGLNRLLTDLKLEAGATDKEKPAATVPSRNTWLAIAAAILVVAALIIIPRINGKKTGNQVPGIETGTTGMVADSAKIKKNPVKINPKTVAGGKHYSTLSQALEAVMRDAALNFANTKGPLFGNNLLNNYKTTIAVDEPGITASNVFFRANEWNFRFVLEGDSGEEAAMFARVRGLVQDAFRTVGYTAFSTTALPSGKSDTPVNSYLYAAGPYRIEYNRIIQNRRYENELIIHHAVK